MPAAYPEFLALRRCAELCNGWVPWPVVCSEHAEPRAIFAAVATLEREF